MPYAGCLSGWWSDISPPHFPPHPCRWIWWRQCVLRGRSLEYPAVPEGVRAYVQWYVEWRIVFDMSGFADTFSIGAV